MKDLTLDIATASTRTQVIWSQEIWTWERFVKRVQTTHRTAETYATYMSSPKPRQAEIKDVGGFVGGYLQDGRRHKETIVHRQLVVLDIDNGYPDLWADFTTFFKCAAVTYSTHAHSMVAPRMRLCIPLTRPVSSEEYEAIARRISGDIGTKHVCPSSFQVHQLMYWPSTSKDGDFYFKEQKGEFLSADSVLKEYRDWRNVAEWPLCPTETEVLKNDLKKQEDPLAKEGVIGAFCRTYSISQAIEEFIPDDYAPAGEDRYTYSGGSTAAGAVCYEDKFLFSHHSTDPASGQLCNAFDLIRIHKFAGDFGKMNNMARTDPAVIHELGIFNLKVDPATDTDWLKFMEIDKKGNYQQTINNFLLILRNDPKLKGRFSYNEFDNLIYCNKKAFKDSDMSDLRHYFEEQYGIYNAAKAKDAFIVACKDNAFHPVKDYLKTLEWDGVERLDTLFIDQLGAVDTPYTRAVTRKALVAAVARVMEPGVKFDYMIVTIGEQGKGKSSLLYDLGKEWFSDTLDSVTGKDSYIQLQGAWILELAELSAVKKAEVEAVKKFLTKQKDRYRPPFGEHNIEVKRQVVFFGSTNEYTFLIDKTGNRRFWPLVINKKYNPGSINADPIWAEAVWRYNQGEELYLSEELEALAAQQQSEHAEADERMGMVQTYLDMLLPEDWDSRNMYERISYIGAREETGTVKRDKVCAAEIWCELFKNNFSEMATYNTKFIHTIMTQMPGWERHGPLSYKKYGSQRSYIRVMNGVDRMEQIEKEWAEL